jgi:hypothetical protein
MKSPDGRECSEFTADPIILLGGRRTTVLKFSNPKGRSVEKVTVDGCAITEGIRCDWLLRTNASDHLQDIFVELKSSHLEAAEKQLRATLMQLAREDVLVTRRCYVVHNGCRLTRTDIQNIQARFSKDHRARFEAVSTGRTLPLET